MKQFSILISVYKHEKAAYLKECFDSILQQTLPPTEIILVEDGQLTEELYAAIEENASAFTISSGCHWKRTAVWALP